MVEESSPDRGKTASEPAESPAEEVAADVTAPRKQHDLVFKTLFRHFFPDLLELAEPGFAARVDLWRSAWGKVGRSRGSPR